METEEELLEKYLKKEICSHPVKVFKKRIVMHWDDYLKFISMFKVKEQFPNFDPSSHKLLINRKVVKPYHSSNEYFWLVLNG